MVAGGHLLEANLIFNMVRETQDHGRFKSKNSTHLCCLTVRPSYSFNSWDRQPFFVERNGQGTYVSQNTGTNIHTL